MCLKGCSRRRKRSDNIFSLFALRCYCYNIIILILSLSLLAQIPFILNIFITLSTKKSEDRNPWKSTTIEWSAPSPPLPHVNFESAVEVHRGPYEYSVPEREEDFYPQTSP